MIGAPFQTQAYGGLQNAGNVQVAEQDGCSGLSGVELDLTIQSLNIAQAAAEVDMTLCVGDQVLRNLSVNATGVRPLANGLVPSPASAGFLRSSFRVSYYGATPQTYMTRSVTVVLPHLAGVAIASMLSMSSASGVSPRGTSVTPPTAT